MRRTIPRGVVRKQFVPRRVLAGVMASALGLSAVPAVAGGLAPSAEMGDGGVSAFYVWDGRPSSSPGHMLRQEPLPADRLLAHARTGFRILYSARSGVRASLTSVSGTIMIPSGTMPAGGWPIVAWEHGTTGIADVCAPSWRGPASRDAMYLDNWLRHGFAVVSTDYEGLGTPGSHPYLLWRSEAYAALDGVRAALSDKALALRNEVVLVGQSQGAGAALGAAWAAPHDAPDLKVRAAVLTGLVTAIATAHTREKAKTYSDPARMDPSFAMLRLAGSDQSLHPDADLSAYLTPKGKALLGTALHGCLHDLFAESRRLNVTTGGELFARGIAPVDGDMERNFTLPNGRISMPVFVGTGLADKAAGVGGQYDAVSAMCAAGSQVIWHTYPGLSHNGTVNVSSADSLPFVDAALSGHPLASNCAGVKRPGPLQPATVGIPFND